MAQTKRKRRTKHRGNAAGMVEVRGRTSRANASSAGSRGRSGAIRTDRLDREPSWRSAANRSAIATVLFIVVIGVLKRNFALPLAFGIPLFFLYTGVGYYTDKWMWQRRMARKGTAPRKGKA